MSVHCMLLDEEVSASVYRAPEPALRRTHIYLTFGHWEGFTVTVAVPVKVIAGACAANACDTSPVVIVGVTGEKERVSTAIGSAKSTSDIWTVN